MIPLSVRPDIKSYSFHSDKPYFHLNTVIIGICIIVYLLQMYYADNALNIIQSFGIKAGGNNLLPCAFTYMFLHGNLIHLLSNLWVLSVIGTPLEKQVGSLPYVLLYICGGVLSGILVSVLKLSQNGVYVGASAAISAVIGAFLIFYPKSRLFILFPLIVVPYFFEISAWLFVILWFGGQILFAVLHSMSSSLLTSSTEYWSHVFGLIIGVLFFSRYLFSSNNSKARKISPA